MTFLAGLAAQIGEWLLTNLYSLIKRDIAAAQTQSAEQTQTGVEAAALVSAQAPADVDKDANASLNNI